MRALTFQILVALLQDPADGSLILERVQELDDDSAPSLPTLYRSLRSALDRGWVEVAGTDDDGTPGRPRQIYSITSSGAEAARQEARRMNTLAGRVLDEGWAGEGEPR